MSIVGRAFLHGHAVLLEVSVAAVVWHADSLANTMLSVDQRREVNISNYLHPCFFSFYNWPYKSVRFLPSLTRGIYLSALIALSPRL